MIIGEKIYKNGKQTGYLRFTTGKVVRLNEEEFEEFKIWTKIQIKTRDGKPYKE